MKGQADSVEQLLELSSQGRTREAAVLLLSRLGNTAWADLTPSNLALLNAFCNCTLGGLLGQDITWLVGRPAILLKLVTLLENVAKARGKSAELIERLTRMRCLLAMAEARSGHLERAHECLCLAVGRTASDAPSPDGQLRDELAKINLRELTACNFLKSFFFVYFRFLRRAGEDDLVSTLQSSLVPLSTLLEKGERRPGVVRALFYNHANRTGYVRLVHVSSSETDPRRGGLLYLPVGGEQLEPSMASAADLAWRAADSYLINHDYPDGLTSRLFRWQLGSVDGDPIEAPTRYEGASVGLALTVAILSSYLREPVSSHVAFTGALDPWFVGDGKVAPVDRVPEKLVAALDVGRRKLYVPVANAEELLKNPVLRDRAQQHGCSTSAVDKLEDVCLDIFSNERDRSFAETLLNGCSHTASLLERTQPEHKLSVIQKYRWHVLLSAVLFAGLFLLEGALVVLGVSNQEPSVGTWLLVVLSATLPLASILWSYGIACSGLTNRRRWPWFFSAALLGIATAFSLLIMFPFLSSSANISSRANTPPVLGATKDIFLFWLFGWALLSNTFCVIAALTHLAQRGQFLTLRRAMQWQSLPEARLPLCCLVFPWAWGALGLLVVAIVLGSLEVVYFGSLRGNLPQADSALGLLIIRDLLFVLATAECMVFYQQGLTDVRLSIDRAIHA